MAPKRELESAPRLAPLIREVIELDEVVQRSRLDSKLERKEHHKFVYMLDPDVIGFFVNPDKWAEEVAALPSLYELIPPSETDSQDHEGKGEGSRQLGKDRPSLQAAALLTSEFVFSEKMVGNDDKLLVAPDHMADFLGYLNRIERGFSRTLRRLVETNTGFFSVLQAALRDADDKSSGKALQSVRDIVVRNLANISRSDLLPPIRFKRLAERDILRNAQCNPAFDQSIVAPPRATVREFERKIRIAKRRNRVPPTREAIESDAVTLCQLTQLNRDWRETKRVFVLVTRDRGLKSAYWDWVDEQKAAGTPEENLFFPLRHPRQYVPILNMRDMPGAFQDSSIFEAVDRAIATIVGLFANNVRGGRSWQLSGGRIPSLSEIRSVLPSQDQVDEELISTLNKQIDDIGKTWVSLVDFAIAAKSDILESISFEEDDYWREFVTGDALRETFRTQTSDFEQRVDQLSVSSVMLRYEVWAIRTAAERQPNVTKNDYGRRTIASQFRGFDSDLFKGRTLSEILGSLPLKPNDAIDTLSKTRSDERLFVTGALCLDIGAWAAAMSLLAKVERASPPPGMHAALRQEVEFFSSVAARLSANSRTWRERYELAERKLGGLLDKEANPFRRARLLSEAFSFHVSALAWDADIRQALPHSLYRQREAMDILAQLHDEFSAAPLFGDKAEDEWTPLRNQLCLNTLCLFYWSRALDIAYRAQDLRRFVDFEFARADRGLLVDNESAHAKIYPDMARIFLRNTKDDAATARVISEINAVLKQEREDHFAYNLPPLDKAEYEKVLLMLSSPSAKAA